MLRRYTWEKAKEKLQHYRRRTPGASELYQIVYHSSDDLQFQWESRFQHQYGYLRDIASFFVGAFLGELWAVTGGKALKASRESAGFFY